MSVDDRLRAQLTEIQQAREQFRQDPSRLKGGGSDGTSGGVTDDWKASVDERLKQLREDLQQVRNWIVVGIAGPLLATIGLYVYTGTKFDAAEARTVSVETRLNAMAVEQAKQGKDIERILERLPTR